MNTSLPELADIGSRVAYARTHSVTGQLTRPELADKMRGLTPNPVSWIHIQMIEGNSMDPVEIGACEAIAKATGISVEWLTGSLSRKPRVLQAKEPTVPIYIEPIKPRRALPGVPTRVDPNSIGGKVRAAREKRDLSQKELGQQVGMNAWMVSRIELNYTSKVHPDAAKALLAFLGIHDPWPKNTARAGVSPWVAKVSKKDHDFGRGSSPKEAEAVVIPPKKMVREKVPDNLVRPRLVTQVRINADESAFYLVCGRKVFRREGSELTETQEPIGALAFNPRLMKGMLGELTEAVKQYEDTFGPIR